MYCNRTWSLVNLCTKYRPWAWRHNDRMLSTGQYTEERFLLLFSGSQPAVSSEPQYVHFVNTMQQWRTKSEIVLCTTFCSWHTITVQLMATLGRRRRNWQNWTFVDSTPLQAFLHLKGTQGGVLSKTWHFQNEDKKGIICPLKWKLFCQFTPQLITLWH